GSPRPSWRCRRSSRKKGSSRCTSPGTGSGSSCRPAAGGGRCRRRSVKRGAARNCIFGRWSMVDLVSRISYLVSRRTPMSPRSILAALLLAAPPLAAQSLTVPATVDTLENGLRVIVHEDHSSPIVTVNTWYHVGSGSEKSGRTGFAHLFEHLMWMGSANAPYPQFDRLLEAAGASNNGSTTEDRTNYYNMGPKSSLELMLWLEADRMGGLLPPMDE